MNHTTDAEGSQEATEAKSLAVRLIVHADKRAEIITGFAEDGETDLAAAFAEVALSFRLVAEALQSGEDIDRPLDRLTDANARARAAMAERRGV